MKTSKGTIVGALLLALCWEGAGMTVQNLGAGKAAVTVGDETHMCPKEIFPWAEVPMMAGFVRMAT